MFIKSYSKINLTLGVNFKSKTGLHEIQSLYCLIDLFDKIKIKKIKKNNNKINFIGPFANLERNRNNSVFYLFKRLRELNLISDYYSIVITKNIPVYGGLGGGTSNAAFLLKYLFKNKINNNLLNKLEGVVGSDTRLFFNNQGFLKNLKSTFKLKNKQKFYLILIHPKIKCSTREIYSALNKFSKKEKFNNNMINSKNKFLDYISKRRNDLQFVVEKKHPTIKKLLIDINNEKGCFFLD